MMVAGRVFVCANSRVTRVARYVCNIMGRMDVNYVALHLSTSNHMTICFSIFSSMLLDLIEPWRHIQD